MDAYDAAWLLVQIIGTVTALGWGLAVLFLLRDIRRNTSLTEAQKGRNARR